MELLILYVVTANFCFTGVQFEATEVATEESEDAEVSGAIYIGGLLVTI